MGKVIFVTYGNAVYYRSLDRIRLEAESAGVFDEIMVYKDTDLPEDIRSHELMKFERGGGYWLWKPWVVLQALERADDDDIIVYSDCGNTIFKHPQWLKLFDEVSKYDAIFYYNGGTLERWSSRAMMEYYNLNGLRGEKYQIISNFFIVRKNGLCLVNRWMEDMLIHPEIVVDVSQDKRSMESPKFVEHRHDQAVLSGVVYTRSKNGRVLVVPNFSESLKASGQAVFNSRISDSQIRKPAIPDKVWLSIFKDFVVRPYRRLRMFFIDIATKAIN